MTGQSVSYVEEVSAVDRKPTQVLGHEQEGGHQGPEALYRQGHLEAVEEM